MRALGTVGLMLVAMFIVLICSTTIRDHYKGRDLCNEQFCASSTTWRADEQRQDAGVEIIKD